MQRMVQFWGKVKKGASRGKDLGFPTANIALHRKIPEGIYVAEVLFGGKRYHAATFIGKAETFHAKEFLAESFLLDFSGNLYGKWITIILHKKIRDNKKFDSVGALISQMKKDVLTARKFFN